jgi:hypothetical protein
MDGQWAMKGNSWGWGRGTGGRKEGGRKEGELVRKVETGKNNGQKDELGRMGNLCVNGREGRLIHTRQLMEECPIDKLAINRGRT